MKKIKTELASSFKLVFATEGNLHHAGYIYYPIVTSQLITKNKQKENLRTILASTTSATSSTISAKDLSTIKAYSVFFPYLSSPW